VKIALGREFLLRPSTLLAQSPSDDRYNPD